jgi:hypothetical protein
MDHDTVKQKLEKKEIKTAKKETEEKNICKVKNDRKTDECSHYDKLMAVNYVV